MTAGSAAMDGTPVQTTTAAVKAAVSSTGVRPGETGSVKVTFDHPSVGMSDAVIRVHSNDPSQPEQTLSLRFVVAL